MHGKSVFSHEWKILLLLAIILGNYIQAAFSDGCRMTDKSVSILKGQDLSMKFRLKHPLLENQCLTWRKVGTSWKFNCTNYDDNLRCSGIHDARYNLTGGTRNETTVHLVIEQAEESDRGVHIIQLLSGSRPICTALALNVTVLDIDPPCIMILQNYSREMEMSCQWIQNTSGENASIVFRNEVIKESGLTSKRTYYDHVTNLTQSLSVFLDMEEVLHAENHESSKCVVSDADMKTSCTFPFVEQKTIIQNDQVNMVTFECCISYGENPFNWWYVRNDEYELIPLREKHRLCTDDEYTGFFCGILESSSNLRVHGIGKLNLPKFKNSCISVFEERVISKTDSTCRQLVLNVSALASSASTTQKTSRNATESIGRTTLPMSQSMRRSTLPMIQTMDKMEGSCQTLTGLQIWILFSSAVTAFSLFSIIFVCIIKFKVITQWLIFSWI